MGLFARKISSYFHSFTLSGAHASLPFPTFSRSHALTAPPAPPASATSLAGCYFFLVYLFLCQLSFFFANYL